MLQLLPRLAVPSTPSAAKANEPLKQNVMLVAMFPENEPLIPGRATLALNANTVAAPVVAARLSVNEPWARARSDGSALDDWAASAPVSENPSGFVAVAKSTRPSRWIESATPPGTGLGTSMFAGCRHAEGVEADRGAGQVASAEPELPGSLDPRRARRSCRGRRGVSDPFNGDGSPLAWAVKRKSPACTWRRTP